MFPGQFPVFGPRSQFFHATIALPTLRCTTHNASPSSTHTKVPADAGEEAASLTRLEKPPGLEVGPHFNTPIEAGWSRRGEGALAKVGLSWNRVSIFTS